MEKISICGYYNHSNFGDDCMQFLIFSLFGDMGFKPTCYSSFSEDIFDSDVVVIGGGGIVTKSFFALEDLGKLLEFKKRGGKLIFLNVNLTNEFSFISKEILGMRPLWVVRDRSSFERLEGQDVFLANDICFDYFKNLKPQTTEKTILVNCNYYIFSKIFSDKFGEKMKTERAYFELAKFLKWKRAEGYRIKLVPAHTEKGVDDRVTNSYLYGLLGCKDEMIPKSRIEEEFSRASFLISSRYHFSLFAVATEKPFIDLTHHSKNANMLKDFGLEGRSVNWYNFLAEDLKKLFISDYNKNIVIPGVKEWRDIKQIIREYVEQA